MINLYFGLQFDNEPFLPFQELKRPFAIFGTRQLLDYLEASYGGPASGRCRYRHACQHGRQNCSRANPHQRSGVLGRNQERRLHLR